MALYKIGSKFATKLVGGVSGTSLTINTSKTMTIYVYNEANCDIDNRLEISYTKLFITMTEALDFLNEQRMNLAEEGWEVKDFYASENFVDCWMQFGETSEMILQIIGKEI